MATVPDKLTSEQLAEIRALNEIQEPGTASNTIRALLAHIKAVEQERDLAIAHDRQPYPTAEAYETVCKALESAKEKLAASSPVATPTVPEARTCSFCGVIERDGNEHTPECKSAAYCPGCGSRVIGHDWGKCYDRPTTPEAARRAAEEIAENFLEGGTPMEHQDIAAIISRHLPAPDGGVQAAAPDDPDVCHHGMPDIAPCRDCLNEDKQRYEEAKRAIYESFSLNSIEILPAAELQELTRRIAALSQEKK